MQGAGFDKCWEEHLSQRMWSRRSGCGNGQSCNECNPATHSPSRAGSLDQITGIVLEELDVVNAV